jgi:hypothetical protein
LCDSRIRPSASGSRARAATFRTLHGVIQTPLFMPVGTQATVKAQTPESLHASGSQILLANTYHLLLRPGPEVFEKMGGIHRFMKWPGLGAHGLGRLSDFLAAALAVDDGERARCFKAMSITAASCSARS